MTLTIEGARASVSFRLRRILGRQPQSWAVSAAPTERASPIQNFALYAVIGTWMEEDIIADTVRNSFNQGATRVFILDNESPDDTVNEARNAGAELGMSYNTEHFECAYQAALINEFIQYISRNCSHDHVWWMLHDADEFLCPEGAGTIRDFIGSLDRRFRVVGARVLNHYPTPGGPAHIPGEHPINQQPLCQEISSKICDQRHLKHPLLRWDRHGPRIDASPGFHRAEPSQSPWIEPVGSVIMHHFPFRNEEATRRRMDALWSSQDTSRAKLNDPGTDHMQARAQSLDAVYTGDWGRVRNYDPEGPEEGVQLVDWGTLVMPPPK